MFMSHQNLYVETLTYHFIVFGDGALKEVIRLHGVIGWGPYLIGSMSLEEDIQDSVFSPLSLPPFLPLSLRKGQVSTQREGDHLQPKGKALTRHQCCEQLDLRLFRKLEKINFGKNF